MQYTRVENTYYVVKKSDVLFSTWRETSHFVFTKPPQQLVSQ